MELKKKKILKRGLISIITAGALLAALPLSTVAKRCYCNRFYEKMDSKCTGISELGDYIDYNMLSGDLKKMIDKKDFKFASDEEKFAFCNKYKDMDYDYQIKGSWGDYFPTDKSNLYDKLAQEVTINGEKYNIYISLVFKTGTFLRPEIVDINTSAYKPEIQQ